jgi:predicted DNA-binding transcriptional regulator AlpA
MTNRAANTNRPAISADAAPPQPPTRLLTITEAADITRTPVATLRYWRHLGIGPRSFRLGRHVVYRADELHAWINTQQDHDNPGSA